MIRKFLKKIYKKFFLNFLMSLIKEELDKREAISCAILHEELNAFFQEHRKWHDMATHEQLLMWTQPLYSLLQNQNLALIKEVPDNISSHVLQIRKRLSVMDITDVIIGKKQLKRFGKAHDGGYVMLDYFPTDSICYSFGICDDVSFDKAMAEKGLEVFMYDHTIENLPEENRHFHFFRQGITGVYDEKVPELRTLQSFMQENGHIENKNLILKMDVEGAEYDSLIHSECVLENFNQIVLELHNLLDYSKLPIILQMLDILNKTHELIYVHPNNYGKYIIVDGYVLPDLLEVTYIRKKDWNFCESKRTFPTELDQPNHKDMPEIILGKM